MSCVRKLVAVYILILLLFLTLQEMGPMNLNVNYTDTERCTYIYVSCVHCIAYYMALSILALVSAQSPYSARFLSVYLVHYNTTISFFPSKISISVLAFLLN